MYAITGANGQLGQLVVQSLLKKVSANEIVALVRDPNKADIIKSMGVEVRFADYNDSSSLTSALEGISTLLLISSSEVGNRIPQHKAVIDAAKENGLDAIVYTSILAADTNPMVLAAEHKETESLIKLADIPYVLLRNGWYSENYTQNIKTILQTGAVIGASKLGKIHSAARVDYAEAAANVLANVKSHLGKTYELAGDEGFTLNQLASIFSNETGNTIAYNELEPADYANILVSVGLPEGFAKALADSDEKAQSGWLENNSKQLSQLINRPTTVIRESVKQAL